MDKSERRFLGKRAEWGSGTIETGHDPNRGGLPDGFQGSAGSALGRWGYRGSAEGSALFDGVRGRAKSPRSRSNRDEVGAHPTGARLVMGVGSRNAPDWGCTGQTVHRRMRLDAEAAGAGGIQQGAARPLWQDGAVLPAHSLRVAANVFESPIHSRLPKETQTPVAGAPGELKDFRGRSLRQGRTMSALSNIQRR